MISLIFVHTPDDEVESVVKFLRDIRQDPHKYHFVVMPLRDKLISLKELRELIYTVLAEEKGEL